MSGTEFLYREHRGTLEEAMRTTMRFPSFEALEQHIRKTLGLHDGQAITVKSYVFDERTGWDTHAVLVDGLPVGFTDKDPGGPAEAWQWQPIATAPKDGENVLVACCVAGMWIVRLAWWRKLEPWMLPPEWTEDDVGWWSYTSSVGQEKMEGLFEPVLWAACPGFPDKV